FRARCAGLLEELAGDEVRLAAGLWRWWRRASSDGSVGAGDGAVGGGGVGGVVDDPDPPVVEGGDEFVAAVGGGGAADALPVDDVPAGAVPAVDGDGGGLADVG